VLAQTVLQASLAKVDYWDLTFHPHPVKAFQDVRSWTPQQSARIERSGLGGGRFLIGFQERRRPRQYCRPPILQEERGFFLLFVPADFSIISH
jgi:hypothetical protein